MIRFAAYPNGMDKTTQFLDTLRNGIVFLFEHPPVAVFITIVVLVALIARSVHKNRPVITDERRDFSGPMRQEAKRLAGNRCEHSTLGFRCRTPGGHADHIYPWSRGGLTTMTNLQSLCPKHNLQKSAHVPSRYYIHRLEVRRRRYFPADANRKVDWRTAA